MKKNPLLLVLFLLGTLVSVRAAEVDLDFAFTQLKGNGSIPFARAIYDDANIADKLASHLGPLIEGAGDFSSYEIVSRRFLTKRIERVIIAIYFDKYPVYLRIDYYETAKGRICLPAIVSKDAADVLPHDLISVAGK